MQAEIIVTRRDSHWSVLNNGSEVAAALSVAEAMEMARVVTFALKGAGVKVTMMVDGEDGGFTIVNPDEPPIN